MIERIVGGASGIPIGMASGAVSSALVYGIITTTKLNIKSVQAFVGLIFGGIGGSYGGAIGGNIKIVQNELANNVLNGLVGAVKGGIIGGMGAGLLTGISDFGKSTKNEEEDFVQYQSSQ
jgi:hypothetical protein